MTKARTFIGYEIAPASTNVLEFHTPELYQCGIVEYQRSHSVMLIKCHLMYPNPQSWDITFDGVTYFSGPLSWKGASFNTGEISQHLELLKSYNDSFYNNFNLTDFDYSVLSERLFIVESNRQMIKIVASVITVEEISE